MTAELTYGSAADVHEYLMLANDVGVSELVSAAANAMNRIDSLERRFTRLELAISKLTERLGECEAAARSANNTAACLANGMIPD